MTLQQFIDKYNGKFIDYGKAYGCQCVDLMRQWISEGLGLDAYSVPRADYAKNIFKSFISSASWTKIINTPTGVPTKGDLVFWNWCWPVTGIAGHVAIFSAGDTNKFISFDQNYPTGSTCRYVNHDYRGVMGWLHKKT
jgi:cell wall-associated NlpC family hydrolase